MQNTTKDTDNSVWKNTDVYHRPVYNAPREKQLTLEKPYILYWTPHATDRAEYREGSGSIVLSAFLEDTIREIYIYFKDGYCSIRDFITGLFAVVHIDRDDTKIRVITCGDVNILFPKQGDYVINRHRDHRIETLYWE